MQNKQKEYLMKAIRIHHYGPASDMTPEDVALPHYTGADVLIRVAASGVNPIDWKIRAGYMAQAMHYPMPVTLGWECAGTVDAVGHMVTAFKPGDKVFALAEFVRGGTYAEYVAIDAAQVALAPRSVGLGIAASLPMTSQAAWTAIEAAQLQPGQRVLIHGGAGGVGSFAIQLARAKGAHVTTTVSTGDISRARELGAEAVIDFTRSNFAEQLRNMDAVVDTIGGATQEASWGVLKAGGVLVALTQPPSPDRAQAAGVRAEMVMTNGRGDVLKQIADMVDAGRLQTVPCHEFPLADVRAVHESGESGRLQGRTVLRVSHD
jgi:NADPH:quinone reductase-like Zn-dependent oxidoreductase